MEEGASVLRRSSGKDLPADVVKRNNQKTRSTAQQHSGNIKQRNNNGAPPGGTKVVYEGGVRSGNDGGVRSALEELMRETINALDYNKYGLEELMRQKGMSPSVDLFADNSSCTEDFSTANFSGPKSDTVGTFFFFFTWGGCI